MAGRGGTGAILAGLALFAQTAAAEAAKLPTTEQEFAPLNYLRSAGSRADSTVSLTWGLLGISIAVIAIITVLVLWAVWRGRSTGGLADLRGAPVQLGPWGINWITIGVGISTVVLLGATVWTLIVLNDIGPMPKHKTPFTVEVIGHQWWWEVKYDSGQPSRMFRTANEIHIPVGKPVGIKLRTADVIHSFWVPALFGKTDMIPGQSNITWIEADKPGIYRGQCAEYCGWQHAHMAFTVVAEPPEVFRSWWDHQISGAPPPGTPELASAENHFVARCGACHAVRGTLAHGRFGPDLSHVMARASLAAGTIPNNVGYLSGWIADPQGIKPGCKMPNLDLSGPELAHIREFVKTLY